MAEFQGSIATGWLAGRAFLKDHTAFTSPFLTLVVATALLATTPGAEAAIFWSDSDPGVSRPAPAAQRKHKSTRRNGAKIRTETPAKEAAKPQGPVVIAISIEKQTLKVYDANGFFAESPVSTGMRGHSTPMGVFSIIQKHKFHRSNIYSGAPMPYMQRITWSGVAMHAGVLPGYPASHGCIRMPMAFATKIWGWTRMGARVIVAPGEVSPSNFAHPLLIAQKSPPSPVASGEAPKEQPQIAKAETAPASDAKSTASSASLDLKPAIDLHAAQSGPKSGQTQTADASGAVPQSASAPTMSDAAPAGSDPQTKSAEPTAPAIVDAKPEPTIAPVTASEEKSPEVKPAEIADASDNKATAPSVGVAASPKIDADAPKPEAASTEPTKAAAAPVDAPKIDPAKAAENAQKAVNETAKTTVTDSAAATPDIKKDQARASDTDKPATVKSEAAASPKRSGQIAVFVSRKDSKLYVRQNFAPLFDVPVTITGDRPLGTHVFTAEAKKDDAGAFQWSVVSLPAESRRAERRDDDERAARRHKSIGAVEVKTTPVPNTPAEALDRLTIPQDAIARIADALTTGGSIVVSDQGIAGGETGEGTDFIVRLR